MDKKVDRCEGDGFANVRFEARPKGVKRVGPWKWKENPFVGMHQFQGLKVLMALLNNWDLKDSNNVMLYAPGRRSGELRYVISDLGATFGKEGGGPGFLWRITRSRNEPKDYAGSKFIDKVEGGLVDFHFTGKNSGSVAFTDASWSLRSRSGAASSSASIAASGSCFTDSAPCARAWMKRATRISLS